MAITAMAMEQVATVITTTAANHTLCLLISENAR